MPKPRPEVPEDLDVASQTRLWAWCQVRYPHLSRQTVAP